MRKVIEAFWGAMASNDFGLASKWLHPDFEYYMPQTREYFRGPEAFAALNTAYPTEGAWRFMVRAILVDGAEAVSDVEVSDGARVDRAITFHTLRDGLILRQREYWPDDYPAPAWRKPYAAVVDQPPF